MMKKINIVCSLLLLIVLQANSLTAQESILKWGLYATTKIQDISQTNDIEDVYTYPQLPISIGAFVQYRKMNVKFDYLVSNASLEMKYFLSKNIFVNVSGSWDSHDYEFNDSKDYSDYTYVDGVDVYSYFGGLGYQYTLGRLRMQASVLGGMLHSSKKMDSNLIYQGYSINLRTLKNETYQLKPSLVYGGSLDLEWLPKASKNRVRPISLFFSAKITGAGGSETFRKISIEEWVDGNVVYQEENRPKDRQYNLFFVDVRFGIKFFLKNRVKQKRTIN